MQQSTVTTVTLKAPRASEIFKQNHIVNMAYSNIDYCMNIQYAYLTALPNRVIVISAVIETHIRIDYAEGS